MTNGIVHTAVDLGCSYAKFKAFGGIVISFIVFIFCIIFAVQAFTGKLQDQTTENGKTVTQTAPPYVGVIFLVIGLLLIVASIFYYRFLQDHKTLCGAIGTVSGLKDLSGGFRRRSGRIIL